MPLGFALLDGSVEFESAERAARRYIRAELNVALRWRRRREDHLRRRWGWLLTVLNAMRLLHVPPEDIRTWSSRAGSWRRWGFINGVNFSEVTILSINTKSGRLDFW